MAEAQPLPGRQGRADDKPLLDPPEIDEEHRIRDTDETPF